MANIINFSNFSFTDKQIRDLNELMYLATIKGSDFGMFHDVHTGIVSGEEIGWLGEMGMIGKVSRGCSPANDTVSVNTVKKIWSPKEFDVRMPQCYTDLAATMGVYARRNGTDVADLTGTDYMRVIEMLAGEAFRKFMWRLWLADTTAAYVADAGTITAAFDLNFLKIVDGYWKQIAAIVAAAPSQQTTLAANGEATKALQFSALTPQLAYEALLNASYAATTELKQQPNKIGIITRYFAEQAMKHFQSLHYNESEYRNVVDGIQTLRVNGIDYAISDDWTQQILAVHDLSTTYFKPHRAIISTKENLAFGIPTSDMFGYFKSFFVDKDRTNYIDMIDHVDVKVLQDKLIQVIY